MQKRNHLKTHAKMILSALLALMLFALTACGAKTEDPTPTEADTTPAESQTQPIEEDTFAEDTGKDYIDLAALAALRDDSDVQVTNVSIVKNDDEEFAAFTITNNGDAAVSGTIDIELVAYAQDQSLIPCKDIGLSNGSQSKTYQHYGKALTQRLEAGESMPFRLNITNSEIIADIECIITQYYTPDDGIKHKNPIISQWESSFKRGA